ncbi:MAG: transcription termination/antitermination protein NusG [Candidatus Gracilibacteria bacterium]|nr:transcription termination/antitermination protein NusG [Candidatus Gracilibacteria bacterium]
MQNLKAEWYVIQVISGTEENVKSSLFQRRESFGLEDYILDVFVPTHDVLTVRAGGKQTTKKKNILPGYILVQMVVTNESWYIVRNTPNVTGFLGAGNIPVPVSGEELEKLKGKILQNSKTYSTKFKVGDEAHITGGAFDGNEGIITDINEKKGTVKMNISLLGRDTPVEIDFGHVKIKN